MKLFKKLPEMAQLDRIEYTTVNNKIFITFNILLSGIIFSFIVFLLTYRVIFMFIGMITFLVAYVWVLFKLNKLNKMFIKKYEVKK